MSDLWDDPQTFPQAVEADLPDALPSDVDVPMLGLVEAEKQANDGALPASRRGADCQCDCVCEAAPALLYVHKTGAPLEVGIDNYLSIR